MAWNGLRNTPNNFASQRIIGNYYPVFPFIATIVIKTSKRPIKLDNNVNYQNRLMTQLFRWMVGGRYLLLK